MDAISTMTDGAKPMPGGLVHRHPRHSQRIEPYLMVSPITVPSQAHLVARADAPPLVKPGVRKKGCAAPACGTRSAIIPPAVTATAAASPAPVPAHAHTYGSTRPAAAPQRVHRIAGHHVAARSYLPPQGIAVHPTTPVSEAIHLAAWNPPAAPQYVAPPYPPPHYAPTTAFVPQAPDWGTQHTRGYPHPAPALDQGTWARGGGRRQRDVHEAQTATTTGSPMGAEHQAGLQAPQAQIYRSNNGWDGEDVQLASGSLQMHAAGQHTPRFHAQDDPELQAMEAEAEAEEQREEEAEREHHYDHDAGHGHGDNRKQGPIKAKQGAAKKIGLSQEFWCDKCDLKKPYKSQGGLSRHEHVVHQGIYFYCPDCAVRTSRGSVLVRHAKTKKHGWSEAEKKEKVAGSQRMMALLLALYRSQKSARRAAVKYQWVSPVPGEEDKQLFVIWSPPTESRRASK